VFAVTVATFINIFFSLFATAMIFDCDLFVIVKTSIEENTRAAITNRDDIVIRFIIVLLFFSILKYLLVHYIAH
jgi:hypothetical protein